MTSFDVVAIIITRTWLNDERRTSTKSHQRNLGKTDIWRC